jgi:myo-inositol-1(or 4)-monophosphatase
VVDVVHDETFTATAGGGAFVNGEPIAVSACAELATALVGTGFAYDPRARAAQGVVLTRVLPRVRDIRRRGAAALDLCWVAVGRLDAFYESGLAPWDLAAGGLIAAEAGAVVRESPGTSGGRAVVAATPAIADDLMALLSG